MHNDTCICGHEDNRHKNLAVYTGWGLGKCTLCRCENFQCSECLKESLMPTEEISNREII